MVPYNDTRLTRCLVRLAWCGWLGSSWTNRNVCPETQHGAVILGLDRRDATGVDEYRLRSVQLGRFIDLTFQFKAHIARLNHYESPNRHTVRPCDAAGC